MTGLATRIPRFGLGVAAVLLSSCAAAGPSTPGSSVPASSVGGSAAGNPSTPPSEPAPTASQGLSLTGRIAFYRDGDLWVMNADGTDQRALTTTPEIETPYAWSLDGSRLYFGRYPDAYTIVPFSIRPDGTGLAQLPASVSVTDLEIVIGWSPDGTQMLAAQKRYSQYVNLWLGDATGTTGHPLTIGDDMRVSPVGWLPDGDHLIVTNRSTSMELYRLSVANPSLVPISDAADGFDEDAFDLSPDGTSILTFHYMPGDGLPHQLFTMDPDGENRRQITDAEKGIAPNLNGGGAAWSPDSSRILFQMLGDRRLYVMHRDGSEVTPLTDGTSTIIYASWSPDGSMILFEQQTVSPAGRADGDLYVMRSDGSGLTQLTSGATNDSQPLWTAAADT